MTRLEYLDDPSTTGNARVVELGETEGRSWVRLDRTWFHPQGGGQRSDTGTISGVHVAHVAFRQDGEPVHYVRGVDSLEPGTTVTMEIDPVVRRLHARLHSGGHLVAAAAEGCFPAMRGTAGHHWPGEARVEFSGELPDAGAVMAPVMEEIARLTALDLPIRAVAGDGGTRMIQIGALPAIACGGTHVRSLAELGHLVIRSVRVQRGKMRIGYDLG